tara:strand:- start:237 stop:443 length:207 start_codon:yes stop_codon:yes gene_type:complete
MKHVHADSNQVAREPSLTLPKASASTTVPSFFTIPGVGYPVHGMIYSMEALSAPNGIETHEAPSIEAL